MKMKAAITTRNTARSPPEDRLRHVLMQVASQSHPGQCACRDQSHCGPIQVHMTQISEHSDDASASDDEQRRADGLPKGHLHQHQRWNDQKASAYADDARQ